MGCEEEEYYGTSFILEWTIMHHGQRSEENNLRGDRSVGRDYKMICAAAVDKWEHVAEVRK
jgi:hypothetical protein